MPLSPTLRLLSFDVTEGVDGMVNSSTWGDMGDWVAFASLLRTEDNMGEMSGGVGPGLVSQSDDRAISSDVRNMRNSFDRMSLVILVPCFTVVNMQAKGSHHLEPFHPNKGTPEGVD